MARTQGFSIVEVVIVIAVIGLIGLIGWRVWDAQQGENTGQSGTAQQDQVPEIRNDSDLDKAESSLDATDIEGSETKQLNTQTSF